uniref:Heme-binding protein 2 n=1 Tax=Strix occidentalis caurina TaxID=311401 RepID=A0A8D0EP59_STROC
PRKAWGAELCCQGAAELRWIWDSDERGGAGKFPQGTPDYELRQYETAKWVSTVIRGETQKEAMRQGFWKLFRYIQGKNDKEMKIDMTVPVTCLIKSGCADFKISFFVPFEHQDSPPQPTDSDVFLEERKAAAIFVR